MSIYEYSARNNKGEDISLKDFEGKVVLVVNTASKCGFTPQYSELQDLYEKYKDNLVVLAFPCNQFGKQEPKSDMEIAMFCDLNFKVSFPLFSKIEVNGDGAHPLYKYLKSSLPGFMGTQKVKWNFTKFLVDKNGVPVKRYPPQTKPVNLEDDINKLIND